ncbi:MAG: N-acetyltransferase family protein [Phycisphaerales bacterium]
MYIRLTEPKDIPHITALINHEIEHNFVHFGTEPELESTIASLLTSAQDRFPWYCAFEHTADHAGAEDESDGQFLGFAKAGAWSPRGGYSWTAEITIYLHPEARGRGVGSALYAKLLETLRAQRFQIVVAGISEPNPASVALHKSIGMAQTGLNETMGYKHGKWIDVGYYQMILGDLSNPPSPVLSISEAIGRK